jgi:2-amino-4-hydroxy-6-hydroxymethyldihydropteridine diphosphokinase
MAEHQLILSMGGNLGNKAEIFSETSDMIVEHIGAIEMSSSVYETPPWGFESEFAFWNKVLRVRTLLDPFVVLDKIRVIENHFGRERKPGNYLSRKMDIDIIFYDERIICHDNLIVPHPLMADRRFVLVPLEEIAPDLVHPCTGKSISEMVLACRDRSPIIRLRQ